MKQQFKPAWVLSLALAGCGGGGDSATQGPPSAQDPTLAQRTQAATQTADTNASCTVAQPFYWEIGDRSSVLASGTAGGNAPNSATPMLIASASKWVFGAYLVQLRDGQLTSSDIQALTMSSGYTNLTYDSCIELSPASRDAETVDRCFRATNLNGTNADFNADAVGKFYYNGGHFQKYADIDLNLGADNGAALTAAIGTQVGLDFSYSYDSPQLAAGIATTPADYGFFLRKILDGQLLIHDYLGTHAVCTNPSTCPAALSTPIPQAESWHYSLAHWVEDDPVAGDGAFSSAGAFGFYPWIDASKTYYGIVGRHSLAPNAYVQSALCGRTIRKAWMSGVTQ